MGNDKLSTTFYKFITHLNHNLDQIVVMSKSASLPSSGLSILKICKGL